VRESTPGQIHDSETLLCHVSKGSLHARVSLVQQDVYKYFYYMEHAKQVNICNYGANPKNPSNLRHNEWDIRQKRVDYSTIDWCRRINRE
jgi:hypothetical protein